MHSLAVNLQGRLDRDIKGYVWPEKFPIDAATAVRFDDMEILRNGDDQSALEVLWFQS